MVQNQCVFFELNHRGVQGESGQDTFGGFGGCGPDMTEARQHQVSPSCLPSANSAYHAPQFDVSMDSGDSPPGTPAPHYTYSSIVHPVSYHKKINVTY